MCPRKLNSAPYKKSMLEAAIKAVISGTFTMKQAASVFGVPNTTISSHLRKKGISARKRRETVNLAQVDQQLMEWLQLMTEICCNSLRNELGEIINEVLERHGYKERLTGSAGKKQWIDKFVTRQLEIPPALAATEAEASITGISSDDIDEWSKKHKGHLLNTYNVNAEEFCRESNASQIFCCFEAGSVFRSDNKTAARFIYKPSQGQVEGDFTLTLYCCICADGSFLKPVAIVKDEKLVQTTMESGVREFHVLSSKEGKMTCDAAMLWLQLVDVEIQPKKGDKPLMLYLDQSIRPLSLATLDFCRQRELILFYLPGHYPNMKFPFGMDIFYNLNGDFDSILTSDDAKYKEITSEVALDLLMQAWKMMISANSSITEFHDFGLVPLDAATMKSTVEAIVPITLSSTEGAAEPRDAAQSPGSSAHVPQTPRLDASSASCIPNTSLASSSKSSVANIRPARIAPKNYKEISDTEEYNDYSSEDKERCILETVGKTYSKKPKIKIKIKRSDRIQNDFSVQQEDVNLNDPSNGKRKDKNEKSSGRERSDSCNNCSAALNSGLRSGVVQGLVFALKRIESSLRADTLNMYRSRYLSPYLNDHRPTEPSFVMWCEIMKCLEMGPDAVHKDFLLSQKIGEKCGLFNMKPHIFEDGRPLEQSVNDKNHEPASSISESLRRVTNHNACVTSSYYNTKKLTESENLFPSKNAKFQPKLQRGENSAQVFSGDQPSWFQQNEGISLNQERTKDNLHSRMAMTSRCNTADNCYDKFNSSHLHESDKRYPVTHRPGQCNSPTNHKSESNMTAADHQMRSQDLVEGAPKLSEVKVESRSHNETEFEFQNAYHFMPQSISPPEFLPRSEQCSSPHRANAHSNKDYQLNVYHTKNANQNCNKFRQEQHFRQNQIPPQMAMSQQSYSHSLDHQKKLEGLGQFQMYSPQDLSTQESHPAGTHMEIPISCGTPQNLTSTPKPSFLVQQLSTPRGTPSQRPVIQSVHQIESTSKNHVRESLTNAENSTQRTQFFNNVDHSQQVQVPGQQSDMMCQYEADRTEASDQTLEQSDDSRRSNHANNDAFIGQTHLPRYQHLPHANNEAFYARQDHLFHVPSENPDYNGNVPLYMQNAVQNGSQPTSYFGRGYSNHTQPYSHHQYLSTQQLIGQPQKQPTAPSVVAASPSEKFINL